jgi:signal transduction histidine kinase
MFDELDPSETSVEARDSIQAALRTVEERLSIVLRAAPVIALIHDARLTVTWAFADGRQHTHDAPAVLSLLAPYHREQYLAIASRVLASGRGERTEVDLILGDKTRTFDVRIEPDPSIPPVGLTSVGFDITPSKLAERELREADHRKDELLATLSHELRNPLTPLLVAFDALRLAGPSRDAQGRLLDMMDQQLRVLSGLVNELLDLSRVTHGMIELQVEQVPLTELFEMALQPVRPMFDEAKHRLALELPPRRITIPGDPRRLTQILTNLLSNAARHTPPGGQIRLAAELVDDHAIRITVGDDGVGIDPELLPRIFEIVMKSRDQRGRARGGLGIGLNLVRKLVELHGGKVEAWSEGKGSGATFVVELPLRRER